MVCVCVYVSVSAYHSACVDIRSVVYLKTRQKKDAVLQSSCGRILLREGNIKRGTGSGEACLWGQDSRRGETGREKGTEKEIGDGQSPFKRGLSECAQWVLLMGAAEEVSSQDPKGRPVA